MTRWIRLAVLFLIGLATFSASIAQDDATPDATATSSRFDRMPPAATATATRPSAMRGQSAPSPTATQQPTDTPEPTAISDIPITWSNAHRVVELKRLELGYFFDLLWLPNDTRRLLVNASEVQLYDFDQPDAEPRPVQFPIRPQVLAISEDGRWIALQSFSALLILSLDDGQEAFRLSGSFGSGDSIAFSPDGEWFALSIGEAVRLWPTSNFVEVVPLIGHSEDTRSIAFSPDSSMLASTGLDRTVRLWDVQNSQQIGNAIPLNGSGLVTTFNPDGSLIAVSVASFDGDFIQLIHTDHPQQGQKHLAGFEEEISALEFNEDGTLLASGGRDNRVRLWNVAEGTEIFALPPHLDDVTDMSFSADGTLLASADDTAMLHIWVVAEGADLPTPTPSFTPTLPPTPTPTPTPIAADPITSENVESLTQVGEFDLNVMTDIDWIPGTHQLAVFGVDLYIYNADQPDAEPRVVNLPEDSSLDVAVSSTGRVAMAQNAAITIVDLQTGFLWKRLTGHSGLITDLAFNPDGSLLASSSEDNSIRIWRMNDFTQIFALRGHTEDVTSIAFSPDGQQLISTSFDGIVRIWDMTTGESRITNRLGNIGLDVAFHPNGEIIAAASGDHFVHFAWAEATSRPLLRSRFSGHSDIASALAFSHDGSLLVSGGWDDRVLIWDTERGSIIRELPALPDDAGVISFSSDGVYLAVLSDIDVIQLWAAAR